ncbi:hypothetical protein AWZ03_006187 [Drosophila navojoa]|uniref:Uncharacterized protein n=1 Tax=Drosophila navojoa TaxID=7232 RepID=A0A484BFE4_DRONA|nr:hypothetical protein AWZ03_006187 [Drosophila navojoa]
MLPMSATVGLGSPLVTESSGSRAGTPTNANGNKTDIPAITVTASPGPASILLGNMKPPNSGTDTRATTPTGNSGMPMSSSGRSQCF